MITIKLSEDDLSTLMLALGYQIGTASRDEDQWAVDMILRITNVIGSQLPNYIPYSKEKTKIILMNLERPEGRI